MDKLFLALVLVIIAVIAVVIWNRADAPPKDSKGSARQTSKPTKQQKR